MRRFAPAFVFLLAAVSARAQATPAHVQSCGFQATSVVGSVACTMAKPIAAGDFLWISVAHAESPMPALTVSGDSGALTADPNFQGAPFANGFTASNLYIASASGGGATITVSGAGLDYPGLSVDEFSGVGPLDTEDQGGATGGNVASTAPIGAPITTTANGDLVVAFFAASENPTSTAGSGWTLGAQGLGAGQFGANEYMVEGAPGAVTATATLSLPAQWILHTAAFLPAPGSPAPPACTSSMLPGSGHTVSISAIAGETMPASTVSTYFMLEDVPPSMVLNAGTAKANAWTGSTMTLTIDGVAMGCTYGPMSYAGGAFTWNCAVPAPALN